MNKLLNKMFLKCNPYTNTTKQNWEMPNSLRRIKYDNNNENTNNNSNIYNDNNNISNIGALTLFRIGLFGTAHGKGPSHISYND